MIAFALSAVALFVGVGAALIVPRHVRGGLQANAPQRPGAVLVDDAA